MCKFCKENLGYAMPLTTIFDLWAGKVPVYDISLIGNELQVHSALHEGGIDAPKRLRINYCPMCGRKLTN